jgi:hypothetical protein
MYNHKLLRRLSRELSRAVQLLLPQQQQKQKPPTARKQERAAGVAAFLLQSLSVVLPVWANSATPACEDADCLQLALQVAESGAINHHVVCAACC